MTRIAANLTTGVGSAVAFVNWHAAVIVVLVAICWHVASIWEQIEK